jgi:hypothetical protein
MTNGVLFEDLTECQMNDAGIWIGAPGAVQLAARSGDPAPGRMTYYLNFTAPQGRLLSDPGAARLPRRFHRVAQN